MIKPYSLKLFVAKHVINPFYENVSFYVPSWGHEKTKEFLLFSGGIERDQPHETG